MEIRSSDTGLKAIAEAILKSAQPFSQFPQAIDYEEVAFEVQLEFGSGT
jgi:hypothetical protein